MLKIDKALTQIILDTQVSKYRLSKQCGVSQTMIDKYLEGDVVSPKFKVCKALYTNYGVVVFPYKEEELQNKHEQSLMDFE